MQRNWKFCPTINVDKLWSLVSLDTRNKVSKDKTVPVIDVTKSVSTSAFNIIPFFSIFLILTTNIKSQIHINLNEKLNNRSKIVILILIIKLIGFLQGTW